MHLKGKLTAWDDNKGYGFITPIGSQKKVFVHIKSFLDTRKRPKLGEVLLYNVSKDKNGKLRAIDVNRENIENNQSEKHKINLLNILLVLALFVILGLLVISSKLHPMIVLLYIGLSISTFITYAIDKSKSINNTYRISEKTLHMLSLLGGWPGAIIAQETLRHKSKKESFRSIFYMTIIFNIALLMFLIFSKKTLTY